MRGMLRFVLTIAVLVGTVLTPAWAQQTAPATTTAPAANAPAAMAPAPAVTAPAAIDPKALASAKKMMEVTHANENLMQAFNVMTGQMIPLIMRANPEKQDMVKQLIETYYVPVMKKHLGEFIDDVATVYAQNFTADEMTQVIAFYQTPVGQKFIEKSSSMMAQILIATTGVRQEIVKEGLKNLVDQMRKNNLQVPKEIGL
jgi:hypothetical protein